ncbi:DMT family transporter [Primorskyibacter sp. S187A]|uniref:DMT family transporter n=1 Tax=Primorskyibacter sp. S187A TaxID=3415130 RepID=UPI003C7C2CCF
MKLALTVALVMVAFAANSILNRAALEGTGTGPASFAAVRLASGAALLCLIVALSGQATHLRFTRAALPGVATLALYMVGFSLAYLSLASGTGALILFGGVQITMFVGAILSREALPPLRILGALLAFGGLVWLMVPGADQPDPLGAILMSIAAIGWGLFSLIGRTSGAPLPTMATSFLWCTPLGLLGWILAPDGMDMAGFGLALICGAITSGLGYALWYRVLPQLTASRAAVAQLTVPVIAALGGAAFLSEDLTLRFALAALLVLGGVLISLRAK